MSVLPASPAGALRCGPAPRQLGGDGAQAAGPATLPATPRKQERPGPTAPMLSTEAFTGNKTEIEEGKENTEIFAKIELKDKTGETCPLKNKTFPVKGSQIAKFDGGVKATTETLKEFHEVTAAKADSKLFLGPNAASFSAAFKEVAVWNPSLIPPAFTGELWGIQES